MRRRDYDDNRTRVPAWDGRAEKWEEYKQEVELWLSATPQTSDCQLAAKLAMELEGPARKLALQGWTETAYAPEEIKIPGDTTGKTRTSHRKAIEKLLDKLKTLAPEKEERRGTYLREFFKDEL